MDPIFSIRSTASRKLAASDFGWFSHERYAHAGKLSLADWAEALWQRHWLFEGLFERGPVDVKTLLDSPVCQFIGQGAKRNEDTSKPLRDGKAFPQILTTIRNLRTARARQSRNTSVDHDVTDIVIAELTGWMTGIEGVMGSRDLSAFSTAYLSVRESHRAAGNVPHMLPVDVSLTTSDDVLIEKFKQWLAGVRQDFGPAAQSIWWSPAAMQGWIDSKVLQYVDVQAYCAQQGGHLTLRALGELLFPDDYDVNVAERCRKVVAPHAERLLSKEFLIALSSQVDLRKESS